MTSRDAEARVDAHAGRICAHLQPYCSLLCLAGGALANFYGKHFVFSFLFAQIAQTGWPTVRRLVVELQAAARDLYAVWREGMPHLRAANEVARDAVRRLSELHEELARAQARGNDVEADVLEREIMELRHDAVQSTLAAGPGSALANIVETLNPERLGQRLSSVHGALTELISMATTHGAAKVGIHRNIGQQVTQAINESCGPPVRLGLQRLRDHSEWVEYVHAEPQCRRWLELGLDALLNSVGIGIALHIERAVFIVANALWGVELLTGSARLALESAAPEAMQRVALHLHSGPAARHVPRAWQSTKWLLVAAGLHYQLRGAGAGMPTVMRLVFFAPLLTERWLRLTTLALRGPLG